jgi:hypothetical protein
LVESVTLEVVRVTYPAGNRRSMNAQLAKLKAKRLGRVA